MHSASGTARVMRARQRTHARRAARREATMQAHHRRSLWPGAQTTSMLPGFVPDETTTIGEAPLTKPKVWFDARANKARITYPPGGGPCASPPPRRQNQELDSLVFYTTGAGRGRFAEMTPPRETTTSARPVSDWPPNRRRGPRAHRRRVLIRRSHGRLSSAVKGAEEGPTIVYYVATNGRRRRARRHDDAAPARTTDVAAPLRGPRLSTFTGAARADAGPQMGRPFWSRRRPDGRAPARARAPQAAFIFISAGPADHAVRGCVCVAVVEGRYEPASARVAFRGGLRAGRGRRVPRARRQDARRTSSRSARGRRSRTRRSSCPRTIPTASPSSRTRRCGTRCTGEGGPVSTVEPAGRGRRQVPRSQRVALEGAFDGAWGDSRAPSERCQTRGTPRRETRPSARRGDAARRRIVAPLGAAPAHRQPRNRPPRRRPATRRPARSRARDGYSPRGPARAGPRTRRRGAGGGSRCRNASRGWSK